MKSPKPLTLKALFSLLVFLIAGAGLVVPAAAQAPSDEPDETEKATNYSLYYECYKTKDYQCAIKYLRWILEKAPAYGGPGRVWDNNIERAIDTYAGLAEQAESEDVARAYLDTALIWFDKAVPTLQEAGVEDVDAFEWTRDKGRFIQEHQELLPDLQGEAYQLYRKAYEIDPTRLQPYYLKLIIYDYAQQGDKQGAIEFMEEVESNLTEPNEDLQNYMAEVRNQLFDTPEERLAFIEDQLEKDPDNVDLMVELFDIYRELEMRDKMVELGNRLVEVAPSARTYRIMGEVLLGDGRAQEALDMFQQALGQEGAEENAREIHYNMGVAYQQLGRLANARTAFRQALKADPSFGQALIAIGDLYMTQVSECGGSKMTPEDQAIYWLVADYYERAKSVDSSMERAANQKLQNVRPYFPDSDQKFFKGWSTGDSFSTSQAGPCYSWINETTTVR